MRPMIAPENLGGVLAHEHGARGQRIGLVMR